MVVIKDSDTKAFGAHACLVKGNVEWVADRLCEDMDNFGHSGKIIIKNDQENALIDLVGEVKRKRGARNMETLLENSKVYDSQSNGTAERAVQQVECVVRTHKLALEHKIKNLQKSITTAVSIK